MVKEEIRQLLEVMYDGVKECNIPDRYIVSDIKGDEQLIDSFGRQISSNDITRVFESKVVGYFIVEADDGMSIIDRDGQVVLKENLFSIEEISTPGKYIVHKMLLENGIPGPGNCGLIDIEGNVIIPFAHQIITAVSNRLLFVNEVKVVSFDALRSYSHLDRKAKIYDIDGKLIREVLYNSFVDLGVYGVLVKGLSGKPSYHIDRHDNITEVTDKKEVDEWMKKRNYYL